MQRNWGRGRPQSLMDAEVMWKHKTRRRNLSIYYSHKYSFANTTEFYHVTFLKFYFCQNILTIDLAHYWKNDHHRNEVAKPILMVRPTNQFRPIRKYVIFQYNEWRLNIMTPCIHLPLVLSSESFYFCIDWWFSSLWAEISCFFAYLLIFFIGSYTLWI